MQNRPQVYDLEQIRSFDILNGWVQTAQGDANGLQVVLGKTGTYISNLVVTPTSPASLDLNISNGFIAQLENTDSSSYGSLPANTQQILQLGYNTVTSVSIVNSGLSVGQSQYVLIEAGWQQQDAIAPSDPNSGILPYLNVSNPSEPFYGPGNSGLAQDTIRNSVANIVVVYGTPATSGMEVPPTPDAGYVPVALIDLAYGQVTITSGEILNPNDVSGGGTSPVLAGLLNSHHNGVTGQAPQIILTDGEEVQGELPVANMVASNNIGAVSTFRLSTHGNPNSYYAGNANTNGACDTIYDPVNNILYFCTTSGDAASAVWTNATGNLGTTYNTIIFTTSNTYTPSTGAKYAKVTVIGGGGSGAGGYVGGSVNAGGGGAGGGGGVQCQILLSSITTPVSVTIGAGGAAAAYGTAGHAGGSTTFGSYLTATGGAGGFNVHTGGSFGNGGSGSSTLSGAIIAGGGSGTTQASNAGDSPGTGGNGAFALGGGSTGYGVDAPNGPGAGSGGQTSEGGSSDAGAHGICIIEEYIGA